MVLDAWGQVPPSSPTAGSKQSYICDSFLGQLCHPDFSLSNLESCFTTLCFFFSFSYPSLVPVFSFFFFFFWRLRGVILAAGWD